MNAKHIWLKEVNPCVKHESSNRRRCRKLHTLSVCAGWPVI